MISNDIKFTPKDGTATLKAKSYYGELLFSVSDTGIGMKKETYWYGARSLGEVL